MSSPDFTTEHSSLLGSSESLESLPPLMRVPSEQEPDWLKDAANTLASSEDAAVDITAAAKAALQRSEETLGLVRKANEKLAGERQAAAVAALAAAEQHAEECERAQAVVAAARAQAQRAQVSVKATTAWSRLGSEAARSAAQAEVERVHAALAVQQQHSTAATRWVRAGASVARAVGRGDVAVSRAQAVLAASADNLERMRRELRASREAGEEDEEAGEGGVGGGEPPWLVEAIRVVEAAEAARGAAPAFFTAVGTLRHGLARRYLHRVAASRTSDCPLAPGIAASSHLGLQRASPYAPQAQLRALELDELDAGLIQLSRRGSGGAVAELRGFGQHTLAVARAAVADCERCAAAGGVRELQSRWRALLLGLPAAAAYAAVAQQSQTEAALANQGCPLGPESERGSAAHLAKRSCGGALPPAQTRRFAWPCEYTYHSSICYGHAGGCGGDAGPPSSLGRSPPATHSAQARTRRGRACSCTVQHFILTSWGTRGEGHVCHA